MLNLLSAIDPANILFVIFDASPSDINLPVLLVGILIVMSEFHVLSSGLNVILFVPPPDDSKNSIKPELLLPFLSDKPLLNISCDECVPTPVKSRVPVISTPLESILIFSVLSISKTITSSVEKSIVLF